MLTIYKYPLKLEDEQILELPVNSQLLSVIVQREVICLYVKVDSLEKYTNGHKILIIGTGDPLEQDVTIDFIGTVQMGPFVWHVFEEQT